LSLLTGIYGDTRPKEVFIKSQTDLKSDVQLKEENDSGHIGLKSESELEEQNQSNPVHEIKAQQSKNKRKRIHYTKAFKCETCCKSFDDSDALSNHEVSLKTAKFVKKSIKNWKPMNLR
jgi:hypothetical protein